MEIQLLLKRKLGFVDGSVTKSTTDETDAAQWETCNNMVISWLHNNISDSVKRSVLFINLASEVWKQLERRFSLTNGSRKYKLSKDLFSLQQNELSISEYYTAMSSLWEEIDSMTVLPGVSTVNAEITALLKAIETMKEESKLFQFLNGLNDVYGPQRSQLLLMSPLPTVEGACAALQQEESQREALNVPGVGNDAAAMYSKGPQGGHEKGMVCSACGVKGHSAAKCWTVIGYPKWHYKHNKGPAKSSTGAGKWNGGKPKMANVAQATCEAGEQGMMFTAQQLQQLLSMMPGNSGSSEGDEADSPFSGMINSGAGGARPGRWIMDSGASDHMTANLNALMNVRKAPANFTIKLPTGATALITHIGDMKLESGLKMLNVLHVPGFTHNLLSIHKLTKDNGCDVTFLSEMCVILDSVSKQVKGVGKMSNGLYYLVGKDEQQSHEQVKCLQVQSQGVTDPEVDSNLWHYRLGHTPNQKLQLISEIKAQVNKEKSICMVCPMAKFTKLPFPVSDSHAKERFELVHIDTWGPYRVPTRGKYRYFLTLVDDFSRVTWAYLLERKSDYLNTISAFFNFVRNRFKKDIQTVRTDNALEFADKGCKEFYSRNGIMHQTTCVFSPQQNARVERKHRQILEIARALKFQAGVPITHWGECILTAVYIINRIPTTALQNKVPYEVLYETAVDYNELKVFGCLAFAANTGSKNDKFQPRGLPCVFLGYPPTQKGFRLMNLQSKEVFISRDVVFHENVFPFKKEHPVNTQAVAPPHQEVTAHTYNDDVFCEEPVNQGSTGGEAEEPGQEEAMNDEETDQFNVRRSSRVTHTPAWMDDYVTSGKANAVAIQAVEPQFQCFLSVLEKSKDPVLFKEAVQHSHWVDAMNVELEALEANGTWDVVELPPEKNAISSKWVYKTKYNPDGSIERYKSRLVILGYKQVHGIDFTETFAPVAKLTTVRALLAVIAIQNWYVCQMDVSNAFLNGDLDEVIYMKMPPGYNGIGSRISTTEPHGWKEDSKLVCRLKKALYGLRQASRQWFSKLSFTLKAKDYVQSKADYSLFSRTDDGKITVILVYVDDILIAGDSMNEIDGLKKMLSQNFHMKDLGTPRYFLGLEIDRSQSGFFVSQKKYTNDLLKEFGMADAVPLKLPMDAHMKLTPDKGDKLVDVVPYQRLVGKLIYLTITRPDIAFAVHILTQFMQQPTTVHMQAGKRLLRYLAGNPGQGILLASTSAAQLTAYCDSDWASCPMTRKSTSGFCILLGSSPLSWKTKKQSLVARSTAESEYRAMALTACEITWLTALLKDLGIHKLPPTLLNCDNKAALSIAANPVLHERTKHIKLDCHYIRDKINVGEIVTKHVPSHAQAADIFTKPLTVKQHYGLLNKLGVTSQLEGE